MYKEYIRNILNDIEENKIIYIASDMKKIIFAGYRKGMSPKETLNDFVDFLINEIKDTQTIVVPAFNWDYCKGAMFNPLKTKSKVGVLGNIFLNREDFIRTKHPLYSFFVYGKEKDALIKLINQSAWGENSPFAYMYNNNAVQLNIDSPLENNFTFAHYVEEKINIKERYHKFFEAEYFNKNSIEIRKYSMFIRDLAYKNNLYNLKNQEELKNNIKVFEFEENYFELIKIHQVCEFIENDILFNDSSNSLKYIK